MFYKLAKISCFVLSIFLIGFAAGCSTQRAETSGTGEIPAESADPAIRSALTLIEKMPDSPSGYNALAVHYMTQARETGDFSLNSKAETAIDRALAVSPDNVPARKLKAALHLSFHRFAEALEAVRELQKVSSSDPFIYGVISDANLELGNYEKAVEAAQKMVDLRPNSASYARAAQMRSLYGDYEGAVELMTLAARTADPQSKEARSWCLVQLGDEHWRNGAYEKAEKIYDEALQVFPGYFLALASKGRVLAARNDFEGAAKFLNDAQNRVPNSEMIVLLGDVYTKLGDAEKAKQQYDLAETVEQKLGSASDQRRLALFWADRNVKLDEALAIAENEHGLRKDIYTADTYAWCLYKKGDLQKAKKIIAEAMRLKTNNARILYHAGMIEKGLGNKTEAVRLLDKALQLNPSFDLIQAENARSALLELKG